MIYAVKKKKNIAIINKAYYKTVSLSLPSIKKAGNLLRFSAFERRQPDLNW